MSPKAETVVTSALRLPREARAFLAEKLLESLDEGETFKINATWRKEIRQRARALDEGREQLIPGEQVFNEVRKALE